MDDFIKVVKATYIDKFNINLEFNDGLKGVIDLRNELWGDVFTPLNDTFLFKQFTLIYGVLSWPNGADLAPEYLHKIIETQVESNISL